MKRIVKLLISAAVMMAVVACHKYNQESHIGDEPSPYGETVTPDSGEFERVIISADDFVWHGLQMTKTSLSGAGKFSWKENDIVGICPDVGTQVRFPIIGGEGQDTRNAKFTGGGWAVKGAHKYMAYYPFIPDMDLDQHAIPVDFGNQIQSGNNNTDHLGAVDFMAAAGTPPADGEIAFNFKHLSSLLRLSLTVPKAGEYKYMKLTCPGKQFAISGTVDIAAASPTITGSVWSDHFIINLNNIVTTAANQNIIVFVMIPPCDFSGNTVTVNMSGDNAECETSFNVPENYPFEAGQAYNPTMSDMIGGDVIRLENGEQFNKDIKSLAHNGGIAFFDIEQDDYLIEHIELEQGASAPQEYQYKDVSEPSSPQPIWAYWIPETATLRLRTPGLKLYANENASRMFYRLKRLVSFDANGLFDCSYSHSISEIFKYCEYLESVDLSGWNTAGIGEMAELFHGCERLTSIDVSDLKTDAATWISAMFSGCKSLTSIDLSGFNTNNVEWMYGLFSGCSSLSEIKFGENFNTASVSSFREMFSECSNLESIDISKFDTRNGTDFGGMFFGCSKLKYFISNGSQLYFPDNLVINNGDVIEGMFAGCSSLVAVDVSNWDVSQTESFNGIFAGCSSLSSLDLHTWDVSRGKVFRQLFFGCSNLVELNINGWQPVCAEDLASMFESCSKLTGLDVSGFATASVTDFSRMFQNCLGLTNLDVSHFITTSGTDFSGMFSGCSALTSLNVQSFDTSKAVNMGGMFSGCSALTSLDVTTLTTSLCQGFGGMFEGCSSLTALDISGFDFSRALDISNMFANCASLQSIHGIELINTSVCQNMTGAFQGCSSLLALDLSAWNTSQASLMGGMFEDCSSLNSLDISGFDTSHLNDITYGLSGFFAGCKKLGTIRLGPNFIWKGLYHIVDHLAEDIATCTIYCTQELVNSWFELCKSQDTCADQSKLIWKDYQTEELLVVPES